VEVVQADLPADTASQLRAAGVIAVDTETGGLSWSADRLHTCQLFSEQTGPIILGGVSRPPEQFNAVLADPTVLKVFHFAPFDLRFLHSQWQTRVRNVACTKAASKLLNPRGDRAEHSLSGLVDRYLGVQLNKGEVRTSDWGRSLSPAQLEYAIGDVSHLLRLLDSMTAELRASGLMDAYRQICDYMVLDAELEVAGVPDPLKY
jgi:ribonuclease D